MVLEESLRFLTDLVRQKRDAKEILLPGVFDSVFDQLGAVPLPAVSRVDDHVFQYNDKPTRSRAEREEQIHHAYNLVIGPDHEYPPAAGLLEDQPKAAFLTLTIGLEIFLLLEQLEKQVCKFRKIVDRGLFDPGLCLWHRHGKIENSKKSANTTFNCLGAIFSGIERQYLYLLTNRKRTNQVSRFFFQQHTRLGFTARGTLGAPGRTPQMTAVARDFLGWDHPLPETAAAYLIGSVAEPGVFLDLSNALVVVPTRNSGRRLREVLAQLAHRKGKKALLPPQVVPPEFLLSLISRPAEGRVAAPLEATLAWVGLLREIDLEQYRTLFPVDPARQDFGWALATAEGLVELRRQLGESGLEISDIARALAPDFEEKARWQELRELERQFKERLHAGGLRDLESTRKANAQSPAAPDGIREIVLLAAPDPVPLAIAVAGKLRETMPVRVAVYAPESLQDHFDAWGRPIVERWMARRTSIPDFERTVHLAADPEAQAGLAAAIAARQSEIHNAVAIGVLDSEVTPVLERRLLEKEIRPFNPQGTSLEGEGVIHLLDTLKRLMREGALRDCTSLLRCPDYSDYMAAKTGTWELFAVLEALDVLGQKRFPASLKDARHFLKEDNEWRRETEGVHRSPGAEQAEAALDKTVEMLQHLEETPLGDGLAELLSAIFANRVEDPESRTAKLLSTVGAVTLQLLAQLEDAGADAKTLAKPDQMELLLQFLKRETWFEDRLADAVDLQGWLELFWEDAPHLVITGFNDGLVPEAVVGDIYLPESLAEILIQRREIALKTNRQRLARDAYLLESMCAWRDAEGGRIDLLFGKATNAGDPLHPSRLLLRCPDDELPEKCLRVFAEATPTGTNLSWTPGFQLLPNAPRTPAAKGDGAGADKKISVTAFKTYLQSPFHFYLRHVEEMGVIDPEKVEMDPLDFGNLCHRVLQDFGEDVSLRDSREAAEIAAFLREKLKSRAGALFGNSPTLPVQIQLDTLRKRLEKAAEIQAQEREAGWVILDVEYKLHDRPDGKKFEMGGYHIRGMIDRIERHEESGEIRILDYKTGDTAKSPAGEHIKQVTAATRMDLVKEYAVFEIEGKTWRWIDLQLALYRLGLREDYPDAKIRCGYFNLPRALLEVGVQEWEPMDDALDPAAGRCAAGVIGAVEAGIFWPSESVYQNDDFVDIHLNVPESTVDSKYLTGSGRGARR